LGGTKIEVIALADDGRELFRHRIATPRHDYRQTLAAIAGLVKLAEDHTGERGSVGIGIPGTLSPFTGRVKNANSVWLNGQPLDEDLSALLTREVRIANDANCLAVSEATDGAGAGAKTVFAVIIGTGCGAGVALNGQAHAGGNGIAGEWGHNPLQGHEIMALSERGDALAEQAIGRYEMRLAKSLAHVINMLDPDVVVLGGGMSNVDRLYRTVPQLVKGWVFGGECETPIRKAVHGDSSGVRGAAWLWPQQQR